MNDIQKANALTVVCNEMTKTYEQIVADQNDYLMDIDTSLDELSGLEEDLEAKIAKLEAEIEELNKKKEDGTITEEEKNEFAAKTGELNNLRTQSGTQVDAKQGEIDKLQEKAGKSEHKSKAAIAKDYGETALEKGQPLSETKDKRKSFWRKAFGGWNKQAERDAGEKLLEAGNGLLEEVNTASKIDEEITKKTKKSVSK